MSLPGKVLELGGGDRPRFHPNVDVRPVPGVDVVGHLGDRLPFADGEFDGVYCRFALEHVSWRQVPSLLAEVARVLRPNGLAEFITANLAAQAEVLTLRETWEGDYESRLLFGDQGYPDNTHRSGLSPELAIRLFREAGLTATVTPLPECPTDMVIRGVKLPLTRFEWCRRQLPADAPVLDIGCADAPVTAGMGNVTWVDSEPYERLAEAMRQFGRPVIPRESFHQADASKLPFPDKSFAVALVTEVLEHVPDPVAVLREAQRVAAKLIITVPNEYAWEARWKPFENVSHARHYTEAMLKADLRLAGLVAEVKSLAYDGWAFLTVVADTSSVWMPAASPAASTPARPLSIAMLAPPFIPVPPPGYGGTERVVYDLAVALGARGHSVTIFAADGSYAEGCHVVTYGPPIGTVHVDWIEAERRAFEAVKRQLSGFDLLHGHNWLGFEYRLHGNGTKILHTHHGGMDRAWWQGPPPYPLNLVAISRFMAQVYGQQGLAAKVAYNGVDLAKYQYRATKGDRLLFVGRIDTFKQPHVAIETARTLKMGLDIVGGTFVQSDKYLEDIVAACDGTNIVFHREPPQEEKVRLMQDARCLLFPSKMGEPFGLVAAEAMACGTPVVALRDGAIAEVVEDGVTGYVVETPEAMAEAVTRVENISPQKCRERVEQLFSRETQATRYEELYRKALAGQEW